MKHDDLIAKNATPRAELERRLMSPNEPKNELEWFARREIERLRRAEAIVSERDRQDAKRGPQKHDLATWLTILSEEVGELAAAILCHRFGNDDHPELDWRKEAIQVAAVALSMVEQAEGDTKETER